MTHSRRLIPLFAGLTSLVAVPAVADTVYTSPGGATFTPYGHLNFGITSFDDGEDETSQFTGSSTSTSRLGFRLSQQFGEDELTFRFETSIGFASSDDFSQTSEPDDFDWGRSNLRHVDLIYETSRFGTFYLGQGSMASDGIGQFDSSGTSLATSVGIGDVAGGFELRDTTGALSGIEIGDAFDAFDGTRAGRIRYDTPEFNGFTLSIAAGENLVRENNDDEFYDIAFSYEGDIGTTEVSAGIGYAVRERPGSEDREDTFGSVAVKLQSGLNFAFSTGDRNTGGDYIYAKVGYETDWFDVGSTALSLDYFSGSDAVSDGDDAESFGIGVVQDFDRQDIEAYFGYRDYSYSDTSGTQYQDASSYIIGARWSF
ncbi:porin [Tateyamaria omphalii]|uniref:porin n=1 Tax=Tateyamaria omphalii TaxID=299262 RepID=UPI0028F73626|nr:porin [Tateyamaria omphalii]